jgi:hypothetical protein
VTYDRHLGNDIYVSDFLGADVRGQSGPAHGERMRTQAREAEKTAAIQVAEARRCYERVIRDIQMEIGTLNYLAATAPDAMQRNMAEFARDQLIKLRDEIEDKRLRPVRKLP